MSEKPTYGELAQRVKELEAEVIEYRNDLQGPKESQRALWDSDKKYHDIADKIPGMVYQFIQHPDGSFSIPFMSARFQEYSGYKPEEIIADPSLFFKTIHPKDRSLIQKEIEESARDLSEFEVEHRLVSPDGEIKWFYAKSRPEVLENDDIRWDGISIEITKQKLAEDELRKSEDRYRLLIDSIPSVIWVTSEHGKTIFISQNVEKIYGFSQKEIHEKGEELWFGRIHPDDVDKVKESFEGMFTEGKKFDVEYRVHRKDGKWIWLHDMAIMAYEKDGVKYAYGIFSDVTDRKHTEETLRKSAIIIDRTSDAVITTGVDGKIKFWNKGAERIFGYQEGEALGRPVSIIYKDEDLPILDSMISDLLDGKEIPSIEVTCIDKERKDVHILLSLTTIKDKDGNITELIGITKEITERKRAEEEQKKLQSQLSNAVEMAHLGPWEYDVANDLFTFNDYFYKILRTTAEQVGGYKMASDEYSKRFLHPEDIHLVREEIRRAIETTNPDFSRQLEHRIIYSDGSIGYITVRFFIVKDENGQTIKTYGVNQDITERKRAEERLLESEEKLARSRKMESLGLLAGGVAHDLNNVLSGIVSYPELLLLDLPEDSKFRKPIQTIQESGTRAVAIVQDLLTIARGVASPKEPLNLNDIIKEYVTSPEFKKLEQYHPAIEVKTDLDKDLMNMSGSPIHIRKLIMNLVSNASEAIEGSGNVIISTMNRYLDRSIRGYVDIKTGEYAVLTISDDGPGILSNHLERIFEPFFTKKVMGKSGTGLGLAVVWNIVHDHEGYIDVSSDEKGTNFELYFPITRGEVPFKDLLISIEDYKGGGETILVVDDEESQREITCKMLDTLGYRAKAVSSGEEAMAYLQEQGADIILLDMIMDPGINGRETYERIIKIHPKQKAIIVSGFVETDEVKKTQRLGAGKYIKKPFTLQEIGLAIKEELKG